MKRGQRDQARDLCQQFA